MYRFCSDSLKYLVLMESYSPSSFSSFMRRDKFVTPFKRSSLAAKASALGKTAKGKQCATPVLVRETPVKQMGRKRALLTGFVKGDFIKVGTESQITEHGEEKICCQRIFFMVKGSFNCGAHMCVRLCMLCMVWTL